MKNLLNIITIICVWLSFGCTDGAQRENSGEASFHRIHASSFLPSSSSCVLSPRASNTKSSLQVVHRHGPCSSLCSEKARTSPNHDDILRLDQIRVKSIHSKLSKKLTPQYRVSQSQSTDLEARDGSTLGSGNYIVTVGIGTPKHDLSLVFDTGSDLTWTQCEPCGRNGTCYPQEEPIFNPSSSSSYSNLSCSSLVCDSLTSQGYYRNCSASNCIYGIGYGDSSFTDFSTAPPDFSASAAANSHCRRTYNNIFSYCLPSSADYTGHLTFGSSGGLSNSVKYTPISTARHSASFYGLDIVGITVAGKELEIPLTVFSAPGAIIDSGTVITRLPPKAYAALRTAFKENMSNYTTTMGQSILDTCYNFTGLETVEIPKVSFSFKGGTDVEVDSKGILYVFDASEVCLAFAENGNDDDVAIFGNFQQKTIQVVYDGAGGRVGFAPDGCM
ncbi:hypothetical protein F2Q70_00006331 [Brassica cretica]|uniref:Peptidase A1 domain-containing protein n=1 Tax=Brassica cretica TaxID=69181 RepID=A0A8S9IZ94_BRACR|nr:hypothetical protein F2Q70_00006331 [Brassica cretica]